MLSAGCKKISGLAFAAFVDLAGGLEDFLGWVSGELMSRLDKKGL